MLKYHLVNKLSIAEVIPEKVIDIEEIMNLMAEVSLNGCNKLIIHSGSLPPNFFNLKTGVAGEILQKFSNYRMKLAIVGDFSTVKSKSLNDFIRESNKWKIITFVDSIEKALI